MFAAGSMEEIRRKGFWQDELFSQSVTPTDPASFGAVGAVMLAVATAAAYLPARRATQVDPMVALRSE